MLEQKLNIGYPYPSQLHNCQLKNILACILGIMAHLACTDIMGYLSRSTTHCAAIEGSSYVLSLYVLFPVNMVETAV